jgi:threonine dehydrogenase-like Zn-dependent dehydrogenase
LVDIRADAAQAGWPEVRALVYKGRRTLVVEERPTPRPGPGEVLLRIAATGICGSDLHGYTGENGRRFPDQVMGHETVARVAASGPDVSGLAEGALVTVNPVLACGTCPACAVGAEQRCWHRRVIGVNRELVSAFAEFMVVPAHNVVPLTEDLPVELGALVEPLAVGYHAVQRADGVANGRVLVVGGGPIGQAVALAARRLGSTHVVVSEPAEPRRALLARLGLPVIDPTTCDSPAELVESFGGSLADVVIDAVGSSASISTALQMCVDGGRVILVGMHEPQLAVPGYAISVGERVVVGSYCYSDRHFVETANWVSSRPPGLGALVEGRVSMDEAPEAFDRLARGDDVSSKVLVFT